MPKLLCAVAWTFLVAIGLAEEVKPTPPPTTPAATTTTQPIASSPAGKPGPVPQSLNAPHQINHEWSALLERLRVQPRAGEINNGAVNSTLADIFGDSPELKAKASTLVSEYEKALNERAAQWENELKTLRTEYEAKIIADLPEAKRDVAKKFLEASRAKWSEASTRDAKIRTEFLERMRMATHPQTQNQKPMATNGSANPGKASTANSGEEASAWMREQRIKATKQDDESIAVLKSLLSTEDGARFDRFNRSHPSSVPSAKPIASPVNKTPSTGAVPSAPPSAVETKENTTASPDKSKQ